MIKEFLEQIVISNFDKVKIPVNNRLRIRSYGEVYPKHPVDKKTFFIQLSYGDMDLYDKQNVCICSYLDFWYDPKQDCINVNLLGLKNGLKGKGYGRKLIESMHDVGINLSCKSSFVHLNCNKSFWKHMGYEKSSDDCYEKKLI